MGGMCGAEGVSVGTPKKDLTGRRRTGETEGSCGSRGIRGMVGVLDCLHVLVLVLENRLLEPGRQVGRRVVLQMLVWSLKTNPAQMLHQASCAAQQRAWNGR